MPTTTGRSRTRFPCPALLLDAGPLIRFYKCEALDALGGIAKLEAAEQVIAEVNRIPGQRNQLAALRIKERRVVVGSEEWEELSRLRGPRVSTLDLGEDESIALALAEQKRGRVLPLALLDKTAARRAIQEGLLVLDFLGLLCWSVAAGSISPQRADEIETRSGAVNGWKRPSDYPGSIQPLVEPLCREFRDAVTAKIAALGAGRRPRRRHSSR